MTATAKSGKYTIVTDYVTDPGRERAADAGRRSSRSREAPDDLQLYVRFDPTVNGNGGGGAGNGGADSATIDTSTGHPVLVASDPITATNAANRDYAQPVYAALDGSFPQATSGFAGAAERRARRSSTPSHALTTDVHERDSTATSSRPRRSRSTTGRQDACSRSASAPRRPRRSARPRARSRPRFDTALERLQEGLAGLRQVARTSRRTRSSPALDADASASELEDAYYLSANVIKASEDKTFPGAIVASLASPWGQAISAGDPANTYFGSYREVFARDLYEAWTGLIADGDLATARDATLFLFDRQQLPDGSMPRNSLVNGKTAPDSFGTQLDETSYPILMADQLGLTDAVAVREPHQAGGELRRRATARRSASSAGRSRAATRPRRSRPRSPASSPRPTSRDANGDAGLGGGLARRRRRLAALDQGLDGDDERAARAARTSSASRRPATRTPRSPTTSATAARRSTSAR